MTAAREALVAACTAAYRDWKAARHEPLASVAKWSAYVTAATALHRYDQQHDRTTDAEKE